MPPEKGKFNPFAFSVARLCNNVKEGESACPGIAGAGAFYLIGNGEWTWFAGNKTSGAANLRRVKNAPTGAVRYTRRV